MQVGAYVVEAQLGQGGMAVVWRVRHGKLGSAHAIKVLLPEYARSPELRLRFLNEGRIQAQFRHPGIVQVTDLLETDDVVGLVMDYVPGQSLDVVLRRRKPELLPLSMVRDVFLQVLAGLGYVHARGVVHRDLKPSNIMVEETGRGLRARVLDFGVAKNETANHLALTRTGMTLGTLQYMSPEQVRGEAIDPRSDLFSLGVVLYEVLTGRPPFDGQSAWSLQTAIVGEQAKAPERLRSDLSPALASFVMRLLEKSPDDRFRSCEAAAETLKKAIPADEGSEWTVSSKSPPARSLETASEPGREGPATLPGAPAFPSEEDLDLALAFRPPRRRAPLFAVAALSAVALAWFLAAKVAQRPSAPDENAINDMVRASLRRDAVSGLSFVRLPAGEFRMGCDRQDERCDKNAPPSRLVRVDGFWMANTQATVEAWDKCVAAGACAATPRVVVNAGGEQCNASDPAKKSHPVNCLTWKESKAFCQWLGGRLPTAAEWEYAAKNGSTTAWPWGDAPPEPEHARYQERAGRGGERTAPVGTHPAGESRWGLHDLAGNVWEVTGDIFDVEKGTIEARGGSFKSSARSLWPANRFEVDPGARSDSLGVRCVFDDRPGG